MKPRQNVLFTKINLSDYRSDENSLYQNNNKSIGSGIDSDPLNTRKINERNRIHQQIPSVRINRNSINFQCDFQPKQNATAAYKPKLAFGLMDQGSQEQKSQNQDRQSSVQQESQSDDQSLDRQYQMLTNKNQYNKQQAHHSQINQKNLKRQVKEVKPIKLNQQRSYIQHLRKDQKPKIKQNSHILIKKQHHNQYQTLSLEQQSLIDSENQKLKQDLQRQHEINSSLKTQINELKKNRNQVMQDRQGLSLKLTHAEKLIKQLQSQVTNLTRLIEKKEKNEKANQKQRETLIKQIKQLQLFKNRSLVNEKTYLTQRSYPRSINKASNSQKVVEKQNCNPNKYHSVCSQKETESLVFDNITIYLKQRSKQLVDDICRSKITINQRIHSMLEDFIQQIIQINPKTVQRVVNKCGKANLNLSSSVIYNTSKIETETQKDAQSLSNCQALTPVSHRFKDFRNQRVQEPQDKNDQMRNNRFISVNCRIDRIKQSQKSSLPGKCDRSQLIKLEKSIDRLKNMEKSIMSSSFATQNKRGDGLNVTGQDLDRSCVMGDRSKSRRKKIFS